MKRGSESSLRSVVAALHHDEKNAFAACMFVEVPYPSAGGGVLVGNSRRSSASPSMSLSRRQERTSTTSTNLTH